MSIISSVFNFSSPISHNYHRILISKSVSRLESINTTSENIFQTFNQNISSIDSLINSVSNKTTVFVSTKKKNSKKGNFVPFPSDLLENVTKINENDKESQRKIRKISPKIGGSNRAENQNLPYLTVLWTALSLALGVERRGELIRGLPCITRFNQLFCRSGGTSYPSDKIEHFIDENKALIRRMHGEFVSLSVIADSIRAGRKRRSLHEAPVPDDEYFDIPYNANFTFLNEIHSEGYFLLKNSSKEAGDDNPYVNLIRSKRQTGGPGPLPKSERDRVDACLSEEEVSTPFWASNSRGKILAIVNTNEFSQIIHQEICTKKTTKRCSNDCGCEQKYKYHRLMAYDPDNDCKGIFMDWFLFPSCCSCRCDPL